MCTALPPDRPAPTVKSPVAAVAEIAQDSAAALIDFAFESSAFTKPPPIVTVESPAVVTYEAPTE